MSRIVIIVNQKNLVNPHLDLRYEIPDKIEELSEGRMLDDGHFNLYDEFNSIAIFLSSEDPENDSLEVIQIIKQNRFLHNDLTEKVKIGYSLADDCDLLDYEYVYPEG